MRLFVGRMIAAFAQGVVSDSPLFFHLPHIFFTRLPDRAYSVHIVLSQIQHFLIFIYLFTFSDAMGRRRFEKMKERRRQIARERISILLSLAEERALDGDLDHASRYSYLARKIGMRYNVGMPRGFKFSFCRHCGVYLLPSKTSRIRLTGNRITSRCSNCGHYYRMPIRNRGDGN